MTAPPETQEQLRELLDQISASGSFESARLAKQIAELVKGVHEASSKVVRDQAAPHSAASDQ